MGVCWHTESIQAYFQRILPDFTGKGTVQEQMVCILLIRNTQGALTQLSLLPDGLVSKDRVILVSYVFPIARNPVEVIFEVIQGCEAELEDRGSS